MQEKVWRKGTLLHYWSEYKLVQPLWKTVFRLLKQLKIELLLHLVLPLLGIYPKKMKTSIQKDTSTSVFIVVLLTIAKTWKPPRCPSRVKWIKKMCYIETMEYYSAIEKNEIMPFAATQMDLEVFRLNEVSQTKKDKYHMVSFTGRIF